jgi:hypothetical protein
MKDTIGSVGTGVVTVPEEWVAVARHPCLTTAARRLAANMLELGDNDKHLAAVFKDAGRYVVAMAAAYLHNAGGLSVPLLKQICASSGFLSPGRARAIVDFLIHIHYLKPEETAVGDILYRPTEHFLLAWRRHLQAAIEAAALVEPALATLPLRLAEAGMFERMLAIRASRLLTLTQGDDLFPALRSAFLHPHAGSQILWTITIASGQGFVPTTTPIALSLTALSRRFGVTHLHLTRLLRRAQEEGLVVYHGRSRVSLTPAGADMIALYYAFQLSELVATGMEVLAQTGASGVSGDFGLLPV